MGECLRMKNYQADHDLAPGDWIEAFLGPEGLGMIRPGLRIGLWT